LCWGSDTFNHGHPTGRLLDTCRVHAPTRPPSSEAASHLHLGFSLQGPHQAFLTPASDPRRLETSASPSASCPSPREIGSVLSRGKHLHLEKELQLPPRGQRAHGEGRAGTRRAAGSGPSPLAHASAPGSPLPREAGGQVRLPGRRRGPEGRSRACCPRRRAPREARDFGPSPPRRASPTLGLGRAAPAARNARSPRRPGVTQAETT
jgi:hypothetical protein